MHYTIRRIDLGSTARLGCLLGWLAALPPALCVAGLSVLLLERLAQALAQIKPIILNVFGQELARIDLLQVLHLQSFAVMLAVYVGETLVTFVLLAAVLALGGGLILMVTAVLVGLTYNLVASLGGGLTVELRAERARQERAREERALKN